MKKLPSVSYFKNKRVLVRADFNVDLENGRVVDDFRIKQTLPTIKYLSKSASKIILISHLGDPKKPDKKYSLLPIAKHLAKLLKQNVFFVSGNLENAEKIINALPQKSICLLENLRFDSGEKRNDRKFAQRLANLSDAYVNDAFGAAHRKHASVSAVTKFLPSFFGLLMTKEIQSLNKVLKNPNKPLVVILGGAKLTTKLPLIKNFIKRADAILLGGGLANTGLASLGIKIGKSISEKEYLSEMKKIAVLKNVYLPIDFAIGKNSKDKKLRIISSDLGKTDWILDIGSETIKQYQQIIKTAGTIVWNGPMGYFENSVFTKGTFDVAKAILVNKKAFKVIGGGETTVFLRKTEFKNQKSKIKNIFISTGGGAMLEYLANKKLPGIINI